VARVLRILAPNPGPFTLEGTNTWVVGDGPALVIDPGPDAPEHIEDVRRESGAIGAILLTHQHPDHAPGADRLAAAAGAPVLAFRPQKGQRKLGGGATVAGGDVRLRAVHTPGHSRDHLAFFDPDSAALFTGDAVLGRGTSVVDPPEGDLADYLRSLRAMLALSPRALFPGHGPAVWDGQAKLQEYLDHRTTREDQVLAALRDGPQTPDDIVPGIYTDRPPELHPLAARSVLAHLLKLEREGKVARVGPRPEDRFERTSGAECSRCGRPAAPRSSLCRRCALEMLQEPPAPHGEPPRSPGPAESPGPAQPRDPDDPRP
jgi:glyoxylase-like metal-dependent hydrolase (beta-lactamase superfamily II)